ncbi:MAG: hypothetical protein HQ539_02015 [Parcubacteria group bacterium]|nr:hypothetical protein [Parcubacteria group bacterium]
MESGTIEKIFNYYFNKLKFEGEVTRALREFFDMPDFNAGDSFNLTDEDEVTFNEWFIFDFKFKNGKTPLEDFYETNPYNFKMIRLQVYKDLQDNHFGLYEAKEVRLGESIVLENLQTGKIYEVREYSATFGLKKGQVFSSRVGKVGDHYELVGSNPRFGPVRLDKTMRKLFCEDKSKLNPKVLRDSFTGSKDKESLPFPEESVSLESAEKDLKRVLVEYDLEGFVDTEIIMEWIYNHSDSNPYTFELNLLCSLLQPDMRNYNKALEEVLNTYNVFYNLCPQKELGTSPLEKTKEAKQKGIPPDLEMSRTEFPPLGWNKKYRKALQYMKKAEFKKALKKYNEVFDYLLENKVTFPDIFRLYTNKGVCHSALGEEKLGEFMLETSVLLNPFYDFGQKQLKKFLKQKSNFAKIKKNKEEDVTKDIGWRYYQFLKPLNINFAHTPKEPTTVSNITPLQRVKVILEKDLKGD